MFGTHPVNISMDSREFAADFDAAFGAKIISYNINVETSQHGHSFGHFQVGPVFYTVSISCYMPCLPIDRSLMDHFNIKEPETYLTEVKTSSRSDADTGMVTHRVDLTYRCLDYDRFNHALRNVAYNRFSEQFHKQLEDKLD